jgi:hypothetical protein
MKTWVLVFILALGDLAARAGAQTVTNLTFVTPSQTNLGAPSTTATNFSFGRAFQNGVGAQIPTRTNVEFGIPGQSQLGAPSIVATNPDFGNAFRTKIGPQIAMTTKFSFAGVAQSKLGVPSTTATNFSFGNAFQSKIGSQITATTNGFLGGAPQSGVGAQSTPASFLFASSAQSSIGQGQGLFAATTNGYFVQLFQVAPNILQFSITPTNSISTNWLVEFSTTNDFFTTGIYSNAVNFGGSPTRLVFGGAGRGDNTSGGIFDVLEATYSDNQIVSFAADFIQFDNDDTNSWEEGSIRYNSTIPDSVNLFMAPVAIAFQKGNAVLTWSTNLAGFQLEYATNLPANTWFTNNSVPAIVDGQYSVIDTNGVSAGAHVYRLVKPL